MISEIKEALKCFQDENFKFDPKYHKYTYDGKKYTSVTTFLKNFKIPFDQEYWSNKKADDYGIDQEEILKEWKDKTDYANLVGTGIHDWIENYYNKVWKPLPSNIDIIKRINKFNDIYSTHLYKLEPIQFELRIFSKKYPIAGTIDSIFLYNGKLFIIDWKSNGNFTHDDHSKGRYQKLLTPFENLYQNHLNEYSIQVAFYALILKEWGFDVRGGYLLHIGPDTEAKLYKCHNLVDQLESYLETYEWE